MKSEMVSGKLSGRKRHKSAKNFEALEETITTVAAKKTIDPLSSGSRTGRQAVCYLNLEEAPVRKSLSTLATIGLIWGNAVAVANPGKDEAGNTRSHESKWVKERQEADREGRPGIRGMMTAPNQNSRSRLDA